MVPPLEQAALTLAAVNHLRSRFGDEERSSRRGSGTSRRPTLPGSGASTPAAAPASPAASAPVPVTPFARSAWSPGEGEPLPPEPLFKYTKREIDELAACSARLEPLSELQRRGLAYLKAQIDAAVRADSSLRTTPEAISTPRLLRFLRSHGWDLAHTWTDLRAALEFRRDWRLDAVRERIVSANREFFCKGGPDLDLLSFHALADASDALQPRTLTHDTPEGRSRPLLDRHGNLVVIECPGVADYAGIVGLGTDGWVEAYVWHLELRVLILDELSRRAGTLARTCTVLDMAEFRTALMLGGSKDEKEGFKAWQKASKQVSTVYPDLTYKNFVLNTPGGWVVAQAVTAMAPARSKKKFHVFSKNDDWRKSLHAEVSPEQLPRRLGGSLPDGKQWMQLDAIRR